MERVFANIGLAFLKDEKLFVSKKVREILFDGYHDPLLDSAQKLEDIGIHLPGLTSKFGLFFGRNDTWYADGITNVNTGENGLGELGRVNSVNFSTTSPASDFKSHCAKYEGSPDLFPPYMEETTTQLVFNTDLCRTLELTASGEVEKIHGTEGKVFELDAKFYANATVNPNNWCFGDFQMPSGMFNASSCRFGAPIYLSNPHFLEADPYYASLLTPNSLKPDKKRHETKFVYEPVSGVPLSVAARFQVNIRLDQIPELSAFKTLPKRAYFPFFWSEMTMQMPEKMATQMWFLSNLKLIFIVLGGIFIGVGVGAVIWGYFWYMTSIRNDQNYAKVQGENRDGATPEQEVVSEETVASEIGTSGGNGLNTSNDV